MLSQQKLCQHNQCKSKNWYLQGCRKQFWIDPAVVWGFIWLVAKGNSAAIGSS